MDYKDWISNRAEEIAQIQYDKSFYDLSKETAERIWSEAEDEYVDYYSALIDFEYEAAYEKKMLEQDERQSNTELGGD